MELLLTFAGEETRTLSVMPGTLRIGTEEQAVAGSCTVYWNESAPLPVSAAARTGEGNAVIEAGGHRWFGVLPVLTVSGNPPQIRIDWQGRAV